MPSSLIGALLDDAITTVEGLPSAYQDELRPKEAVSVATAVAKRVEQFTAGRTCARRALHQLGFDDVVIPAAADRAPIWPAGAVGSITHTDQWCAASVARGSAVRSVGIDVEPSTALKPALLARVCSDAERAWLEGCPGDERGQLAKAVFCIKEAVYKCQYPITEQYLGFHAVELELDLRVHRFEARFCEDVGAFAVGERIVGRFVIGEELIAAACSIAQSDAPSLREPSNQPPPSTEHRP